MQVLDSGNPSRAIAALSPIHDHAVKHILTAGEFSLANIVECRFGHPSPSVFRNEKLCRVDTPVLSWSNTTPASFDLPCLPAPSPVGVLLLDTAGLDSSRIASRPVLEIGVDIEWAKYRAEARASKAPHPYQPNQPKPFHICQGTAYCSGAPLVRR